MLNIENYNPPTQPVFEWRPSDVGKPTKSLSEVIIEYAKENNIEYLDVPLTYFEGASFTLGIDPDKWIEESNSSI